MPLTLSPLMTYRADFTGPDVVGPGPFGVRQVFTTTGGEAKGARLSGTLRAVGGDWLLAGPDGFGRLDARATIETDDGALVYVSLVGVVELSERAMQALTQGETTEFGEIKLVTQHRFETGDPRYTWVNSAVCVAEGASCRVRPSSTTSSRSSRRGTEGPRHRRASWSRRWAPWGSNPQPAD